MASSSSSAGVGRALCLLLLACLSVAVAADTAFLVVHKKAIIAKVKASERVTVSISLYNAGAAYVPPNSSITRPRSNGLLPAFPVILVHSSASMLFPCPLLPSQCEHA